MFITQQDHASIVGYGGQESRHQRQIDHRCFVDQQHVDRQGVARVMSKHGQCAPANSQASMNRLGDLWNRRFDLLSTRE
jgi:hypothetical protein